MDVYQAQERPKYLPCGFPYVIGDEFHFQLCWSYLPDPCIEICLVFCNINSSGQANGRNQYHPCQKFQTLAQNISY